MSVQALFKPEEELEMLRDCMRALHATVKDKTQPATARQQATRTLLEALQVIGSKAKEREQPVGRQRSDTPTGTPMTEEELRTALRKLNAFGEKLQMARQTVHESPIDL